MANEIRCIVVDDEPVARDVLENHLQKIEGVTIVAMCKNAVEAFKTISSDKIDLIFLDINMPEISGLSFAKSINKRIKIIFTTAYREYAVDGFDLQAVDYLLKPISFERLFKAINKFFSEKRGHEIISEKEIDSEKSPWFFVRSNRKMIKINFSEIQYVESLADYIKIHILTGTVVARETITNIELKLNKKDFIRTHRSFIVAVKYVTSFTSELVEIGSKQIPISRSYKNEVLEKLAKG